MSPAPSASVVIATYNRPVPLIRLLQQLEAQSACADQFEIIVVDDGSVEPVAPRLPALGISRALRIVTQANAGAAAARHTGISMARGEIIVIVDDDMQVSPDFVTQHLSAHPPGTRRAVLGWVRPDPAVSQPFFERHHARVLEQLSAEIASGRHRLQGTNLYTGNVSFRRADYFAVGGFDSTLRLSEDAELGVRLEKSGVELCFCTGAASLHATDRASLRRWIQRAFQYGIWDLRIGRKHPDIREASPWRFLPQVSRLTRPMLLATLGAPSMAWAMARVSIGVAVVLDKLGAGRLALAGATFAYGLEYFRGVRAEAGSFAAAIEELRRYLRAPADVTR